MQPVYLDNNATTRVDPEVVAAMLPYFSEQFGNASSMHAFGADVGGAIKTARQRIQDLLGAEFDHEIVFTSGGTESDNTAILSALETQAGRNEVVTSTVEHPAILALCEHLEKTRGVKVHRIPVDSKGRLDINAYRRALGPRTAVASIMWANNETGTIFPVEQLAEIAHEAGALFHTDAVQAAGKLPINLKTTAIDMLSFSAHKLHGPKGIGGLYVRAGVSIRPTRFGGTGVNSVDPYHLEEYPYRLEAGTGNVLGIAGLHFAQAYIAKRGIVSIYAHEMELFASLQGGLAGIEGVTLHGTTGLENRLPVLSFTVAGRDPADIGTLLDVDYNIAARTGLQCAPLIHQQMGTGERGTVRLSVGPMNRASDVDSAVAAVAEIAAEART